MAGDQRLGGPVLPGRGELPSPICSECAPCTSGLCLRGREACTWSLKTAGVTEPEFPRRGLKELVPCEAIDRESVSS